MSSTRNTDEFKLESDGKIENEVKKWLEGQGYPLEMMVASEFQRHGFNVQQSAYYKDPETGKSREIDVVASKSMWTEGGSVLAVFRFVIECKSSKGKPWIVFTRNNTLCDFNYVDWYCTSELGAHYVLSAAIEGVFDRLSLTFHKPASIGYAMTQAFTSAEDITYKALNGVVSCATAFTLAADNRTYDVVDITIPIIVIGGELFESQLQDGDVSVRSIQDGVMRWDAPLDRGAGVGVHILTQHSLLKFIQMAVQTIEVIQEDWAKNLCSIISSIDDLYKSIEVEKE